MTEVAAPEAPASLFTALDRCDRCGAQAKTMALFVAGPLLFCGHHAKKYMLALAHAGVPIESDE